MKYRYQFLTLIAASVVLYVLLDRQRTSDVPPTVERTAESPMPKSSYILVWVIYDNPKDFPPGTWVVRCWRVGHGQSIMGPVQGTAPSLFEAQALVPPSAKWIPRFTQDDPTIVATYLGEDK